jgi:hypothetical protein
LDSEVGRPIEPSIAKTIYWDKKKNLVRFSSTEGKFLPVKVDKTAQPPNYRSGNVFVSAPYDGTLTVMGVVADEVRSLGGVQWTRREGLFHAATSERIAALQVDDVLELVDFKMVDRLQGVPNNGPLQCRPGIASQVVAGSPSNTSYQWGEQSSHWEWSDTNHGELLVIENNLLIVAAGAQGVTLVDVSNPDSPEILGTQDLGGLVQDLRTSENFLMARVRTDPTAATNDAEVRVFAFEDRALALAMGHGLHAEGQ